MGVINSYRKLRFKLLSNSNLEKRNRKLEKYIIAGKVDIQDSEIRNWYLNAKVSEFKLITREQLDILLGENVFDVWDFIKNEITIEVIENKLLNSLQYILREPFNLYDKSTFVLLKMEDFLKQAILIHPNMKEYIQTLNMESSVGKWIHENMTKYYSENEFDLLSYKKMIEIMIMLGYRSFHSTFKYLEDSFMSLQPIAIQEYYNAIGLMDFNIVKQLYLYKLAHTEVPISINLEPSEDDVLSNYWRNQTRLLGKDALKAFGFAIETGVPYAVMASKKFNNKMPFSYNAIKYHYENVFQSDFDAIENPFIKKCIQYIYFQKSEVKISLSEQEINQYFNELGELPALYQFLFQKREYDFFLKEKQMGNVLGKGEAKYLEFLKKIKINIHLSKSEINQCFDELGERPELYHILFQKREYNILWLLLNREQMENVFGKRKTRYIEFLKKTNFKLNISEGEINQYFDELGALPKLYQFLFQEGTYSILLSLDKKQTENILGKRKVRYMEFIKDSHVTLNLSEEEIDQYFDELGALPQLYSFLFQKWEYNIIFQLLSQDELRKIFDEKQLKLMEVYGLLNKSIVYQSLFKSYVTKNYNCLTISKIEAIVKVINSIAITNSSEIKRVEESLIVQLMNESMPLEKYKQVEDIYLKNNIPEFGKRFKIFQTLHPNYQNIDISSATSPILTSQIPVLKSNLVNGKDVIIFSDLAKCALGSNNRSVIKYIENIEKGEQLFCKLNHRELVYEQLEEEEKQIITEFFNHLATLYVHTKLPSAQTRENPISWDQLIETFAPFGNIQYNLKDRITKMFFHFAGFDTFESVKQYMQYKVVLTDQKNRRLSKGNFKLEIGDFVKGIGAIKYLHDILQNGSLAKEFLGDSASSDNTPLDTDLSRILEETNQLQTTLAKTIAFSRGPIYLVLKCDDRFQITRENYGEDGRVLSYNPNKLEAFCTLEEGHYGIRTGFASSEIDYIITATNEPKIGLEIAMNGFYIPVIDLAGKLIFTPEDYDKICSQMMGLSYYGKKEYQFSNQLVNIDVLKIEKKLDANERNVKKQQNIIYETLKQTLENEGYTLKWEMDNDLTPGSIELIDTGSTGRFTNVPSDIDFDFVMRLDRDLLLNTVKLNDIKTKILKALGKEEYPTWNKKWILENATVEGINQPIKIDISFIQKTNHIDYSTDMAIKERLQNIRIQDETKYRFVLANIILAKQVLKDANVYKRDSIQGGLGGVGIENWILQNGGSFVEAANSFLKESKGKGLCEFQKDYAIWDFGSNHYTEEGLYPHDNFVNNINEVGYKKMKQALKQYLIDFAPPMNLQEQLQSEMLEENQLMGKSR